ncbi:Hypothetical protein I5071_72890 [Sandaracinus amylolyticus]|nr:Hypothetical protein I5071_72890 [Sandaracinus amylolyticus]
MRFVGIDIGSEKHVVAIVDEAGKPVCKPTPFSEDASGYDRLRSLLGEPADVFVAMEATGHYWQNLFAFLFAAGFQIALLNPMRTSRFAAEDLRRAKTDALDAVGIAVCSTEAACSDADARCCDARAARAGASARSTGAGPR